MNCIPRTSIFAAFLFSVSACMGSAHETRESRETRVAHPPALSLAAGISIAEKSESGLQFLAAEIENEGGKVICSVLFGKGASAREINVDATSGAIARTEDEKLGARHRELMQDLRKSAGAAATDPGQAIEAALKRAPGTWAREIKLESEHGALVYEVLLGGGKEELVAQVSATDGSVKKLTQREEEEADEGDEQDDESSPK